MSMRWVLAAAVVCAVAGASFAATDGAQERAARGEKLLVGVTFSHPREITNAYLPLASLKQDVLEGTEGKAKVHIERTLKAGIHKVFVIAGQKVEVLAVEDREMEDGVLAEVATDYFAQDDNGTVYYLGEDVDEYENGKVTGHGGAWLLGKDTKVPGVILPGKPKVGDRFWSEDVSKEISEEDEVMSLHEKVVVPAGTFENCVKVKEMLGDGTTEYKYYATGVGVVREVPAVGDVLLISHGGRVAGAKKVGAKAVANGPQPVVPEKEARAALDFVGADPEAEAVWMDAINDPNMSADARQNLIEDLNENGISNPDHPTADDLPLIESRLALIEDVGPNAMDDVNAAAFQEAYKDLVNMEAQLAGK